MSASESFTIDPYVGWRVGDGECPLYSSTSQIVAPGPHGDGEMIAASFNPNFEELSSARCKRAVECVRALEGMDPNKLGYFIQAVESAIDFLYKQSPECLGVDPKFGYSYRNEMIGRLNNAMNDLKCGGVS